VESILRVCAGAALIHVNEVSASYRLA